MLGESRAEYGIATRAGGRGSICRLNPGGRTSSGTPRRYARPGSAGRCSPGLPPASRCHTRLVTRPASVALGGPLRIQDVVEIARGAPAMLTDEVLRRVDASRQVVVAALETGAVVYGV